jgi:hypothetical protein
MKKLFCLIFGLVVVISCGTKQSRIDKIYEDGVEVVLNHFEPYKLTQDPLTLRTEQEFSIDTEREDIVPEGFVDLDNFDVDSSGNIYFFQARESDINLVYKFDKNGRHVSTFGKKGQGPGEVQSPIFLGICKGDEIWIQDSDSKFIVFDTNGTIIRQNRLTGQGFFVNYPLVNGNYLRFRDYTDPKSNHRFDILLLCNSRLEEIAELGRCDYGLRMSAIPGKMRGTPRIFIFRALGGKVYLGDEGRGYEISVFDENGTLLRKIRKEYSPADAPREFLKVLVSNWGRYKDKLILPDKMPPFHYFFLDDEGRLYVKTYEPGVKKGEYIHDIFTADGVLIARKSLPGYGLWMYPGRHLDTARAKNGRLYCIREKESGFKELVVYKMIWR